MLTLSYSIAFQHYLRQRPHGQGLICHTAALVNEWMHFGIRQSSQCTVKCGAEPHPWRNNSDHDLELNQTNMTKLQKHYEKQWGSKQVVHRCTESEGNIGSCQYTRGQMYHSKSFEIRTQFQYEEWYFLQTCVLLVQVGISWYYTPTQLCMYTLNRRHAYLHTCMHTSTAVVREHTYIYINVNVHIQVCRLVHGSIRTYL